MSNDTQGERRFSFSRFARQPFYTAVNARLVELAGIGSASGVRVLDLACGTGAVTKIILQKLEGLRQNWVIAMDASAEALELARRELAQAKSTMVRFVQGRAEQVSQTLQEKVDAVIFCNAIHMIEEKEEMIREIRQVLAPGGIVAFNTTFFAGAQPPETEQFYRRWMTRAIRLLKRSYGLQPSREKVAARRQLSPEQYESLLQQEGFTLRDKRIDPVDVPLEGWLGISEFSDFIQGALPGVPLAEACQALQEAVTQVFEELKLQAVPRLWLYTVAVKPC
ncbi:MAG: hypothetical protein A2Z21_06260 [Candidatus Fraserbacteria bacterium RBG_16_55_9]|uniref:Methyltransferase domain-containing protein n=1 Tax=Fraserbacteria sp. (strain RBG_16_55_9) TaxID=1817864 RepID=A0A1F5USU5_FRAXR|nr:MAG: hypothetical protein A2Z21_06260 [Candidatus Fraserbacteria bacterium RBG_16_55_9]